MDLPTAWNLDDKSTYLSVDSSGLRVNHEGPNLYGTIRANHPIPPQCKLFYFEVDIINEGSYRNITIGLCEKSFNLNGSGLGLQNGSWGYFGCDGNIFDCSKRRPYGPSFSTGDTIGCCFNFKNNTVFFTKNGINLGIAFRNLKGTLYPCVGMRSEGEAIEVNFGSRKFKYAATISNDMGDELLKNKLIDAFNMCINTTNIYTLEDLENSLKIKQDNALKFRGKFNFIMGSYEDAIIDLTKLVDIEPNSKFALRYRAEAYYLMERYKEAIIDLTKLVGIESSDDVDESLKKKWIEAFNKCNDATNTYTLENLENSLKITQDTALKFRGKFKFILGSYEDAIIDLTKLLDIEPNNKFALRYRAEAYYLMKRYKEAIIDLTKLLDIEPNNKFALRYLGETYHLTKEAIIDLAKLLGIEPSDDIDESLKKKLVDAFNMCNNTTNTYTLEDLENFLETRQDTALKFRVKFNFIMERYQDAIIDLTKLLDIEPNSKFALRYRAKAYYLMEKYKESFNDVNKLLKIESNDEWVSKHFEKICEEICEKDLCADESCELGYFYLHGINVKKDEYKAFAQFEKSANMGHTEGINCLGYCYEYGIGIEKDENKAFIYYQKSADANNSNGMFHVGYCYYLGIGVEIDKHKAFTYYLKSAEAGNSMGIWKTAICYLYGIGVEKTEAKFAEWMNDDPIYSTSDRDDRYCLRNSEYGKCAHCHEDNTNEAWCLSCDPDIATRFTSRNRDIDNCMKMLQLRVKAYEDAIEWIPFDRLSKIKEIGKGGFGFVYSARWLDGIRRIEEINDVYKRAREPSSIVALKTLTGSKENNFDFLKEFKSFMTCKLNYSELAIYGITQNTKTKEYLMVFQFANNGSLHKYLKKNFCNLTWRTKLQILKDISYDLHRIHDFAGYIHADFHSGNILYDQRSYITDLGLSRKKVEGVLEGEIYGVMPYVAPEVLLGEQQFTQAADIYGFGIIMAEMTSGQRPFDGYEFGTKLAAKICKGLRPEFAPETPKCYIELAEKCMDSDPQKRPRAYDVHETINKWLNNIVSSANNKIKRQFFEADKATKSLPISKHSDEMYTSKIISTKLISKAIKDLSNVDSVQINLDVTEPENPN